MWFYFSSTYQDFLFKGVNISTTWGMLSLCLGLMSLALLVEGLRVGRSHLFKLARQPRGCEKKEYNQRVQYHILQTVLQLLQFGVTYITMLSVMTYNAYFMIAIIGGSGLGYYFFAAFDFPNKVLGVTQPSCKGRDDAASEGNQCQFFRDPNGSTQGLLSSVGPCPMSDSQEFHFSGANGVVNDFENTALCTNQIGTSIEIHNDQSSGIAEICSSPGDTGKNIDFGTDNVRKNVVFADNVADEELEGNVNQSLIKEQAKVEVQVLVHHH